MRPAVLAVALPAAIHEKGAACSYLGFPECFIASAPGFSGMNKGECGMAKRLLRIL